MEKTEALACLQTWHNKIPEKPGVEERMPQQVSAVVIEAAGITQPNGEA